MTDIEQARALAKEVAAKRDQRERLFKEEARARDCELALWLRLRHKPTEETALAWLQAAWLVDWARGLVDEVRNEIDDLIAQINDLGFTIDELETEAA